MEKLMYNKTHKLVLQLFLSALIIISSIAYPFAVQNNQNIPSRPSSNNLILVEKLFNGINLQGWNIHGTEHWYVESGELVCESGPDHEYGYLSSVKQYKDFDLSLLFKQESDGNSGVFFRSTFEETKVSGWQVEVAPRGHDTGGIYESYGRGWLATIPDNEEGVLSEGSWNKLRIRVIGDRVQTWLNGIIMVDINDKQIGEGVGSIALQIHSGDNVKVRWRDIRLTEFLDISGSVKEFPSMNTAEQIQLIASLTPFANNPKIFKIIKSSLKSKHLDLRISALRAAGQITDPKVVTILVKHASKSDGVEKQAALESLYTLNGKKINNKLLSGLSSFFMKTNVKVEFIRAVRERQIKEGAEQIIGLASKRNSHIRLEAVKTLNVIADIDHIPACINLLANSQSEAERNILERTVANLIGQSSDSDHTVLLITALNSTKSTETQISLITVMGELKNDSTLPILIPLLNINGESPVKLAVITALSGWATDKPLPALMEIVEVSLDPAEKKSAIKGAVRLLGLNKQRATEETVRLYQSVLNYATYSEDKKALLSGLKDVQSLAALEMAMRFLKDDILMFDAEIACIAIANNIHSLFPTECKSVMIDIINTSKKVHFQRKAQSVLNKIERMDDYITQWLMSEPFSVSGKSLYSTKFVAEVDSDSYPLWRNVPEFSDKDNYWHVNLSALKTSLVAAVYLKTNVWSEIEQTVRLEMGSNDGIKAWINNELVHLNAVARGVVPGQDVVNTQLNKGWNTLLLKIVNEGGGGWGACARLRRMDGGHLSNVNIKSQLK